MLRDPHFQKPKMERESEDDGKGLHLLVVREEGRDWQGTDPVKTKQRMVGHPLPEGILEQMC
jgi:hypothetical protein